MPASPPLELLTELSHPFEAELLRQVLERHEIVCFVEGMNSASNLATKAGVGAIRLWVAAVDLPEAQHVLHEAEQARTADWYCDRCDEWIGAGFDWCWKCGQPRSCESTDLSACAPGQSKLETPEAAIDLPDAQLAELEDKVCRAWRASVIGLILLPVGLHLFSCVFLAQTLAMWPSMDRRQRCLFVAALAINLTVFAFVGYVLFYLLRN